MDNDDLAEHYGAGTTEDSFLLPPDMEILSTFHSTVPSMVDTVVAVSATEPNVADARFDKIARLATLYVQICLGSLGGLLVCGYLWRNRGRRSRVNAIILGVTVADLLVICFACIMQLVWEHMDRVWLAGDVMCRLLKFLQTFSITSSVAMLLVLSIDRHQAIRAPLKRPIPVRHMTAAAYLGSALLCVPQLAIFHAVIETPHPSQHPTPSPPYIYDPAHPSSSSSSLFSSPSIVSSAPGMISTPLAPLVMFVPVVSDSKVVCESIFRNRPLVDRQAYLTFVNVALFLIPTVVMFVCYIRIFFKIAAKVDDDKRSTSGGSDDVITSSKKFRKRTSSSKSSTSCKIQLHSTNSDAMSRAKLKTLKMTVVIVSTFVLCSSPYHILEMIYSYGAHTAIPGYVAGIFGAMVVANSVTNPFVFLFFNVNVTRYCCLGSGKSDDTRNGTTVRGNNKGGSVIAMNGIRACRGGGGKGSGGEMGSGRDEGMGSGMEETVILEVCRDLDGRTYTKIDVESDLDEQYRRTAAVDL